MSSPERLELRPSRKKWTFVLLVSAGFVAAGVRMIADDDLLGWLVAGFFALGIPIAVPNLLPGRSSLVLSPAGFTIKTPLKARTYRWDDVVADGFRATSARASKQVAWTFAPTFREHATLRDVNRALGVPEAALPDTYGMTAPELASLMNEWHGRYARDLREPPTPTPREPIEDVFDEPPGRA